MKIPTRIEEQIQDKIWVHNRDCRNSKRTNLMFDYGYFSGTISTTHYHFVFLNNSKHRSLVLTIWNGEKDWKKFDYTIVTNDVRFHLFVAPIVRKYVKDMYEYYDKG